MLDAVGFGPVADDVVAHRRAEARRRIRRTLRFDGREEELRHRDIAKLADEPLQFGLERASVERRRTRQIFRALDLERRLTVRDVVDRQESRTAEIGIEQSSDDGGCSGAAPAKRIGQFAQPRLELRGLALQREPIAPWLELREERLDHF